MNDLSRKQDECADPPRLVLLGDSDIDYWPDELFPTINNSLQKLSPIVRGHSGATLRDVLPHLQRVLDEHGSQPLLIVACAGENDIGEGISLDNSIRSLEKLLKRVFESSKHHRLIFLGPKFEPWLENSMDCKKNYSKMSRSFNRCLQKNPQSERLHYIDCLTMFCGETASVPGAVLGGRARAEYKYFQSDLLHLSNHGYKIWKDVVEKKIREFFSTTSKV
jgi:lysophospholipase L1-like esterase